MMPDNPFWDKTAGQMLAEVAARYGQHEAIVFGERRITYREFQQQVERLARGLLSLGVQPGDKVAIWLPNRPAWLFCQYACASLGATVVALNPRYKAHELAYILGQSDSTVLLFTDRSGPVDFLETLAEVLPELGQAKPGNLHSERLPLLRWLIVDAEVAPASCLRLGDVLAAGDDPELEREPRARQAALGADDLFTILYTSGTTSFPKGATISHRNCLPHGWNCGVQMEVTPDDRVLHTLPLSGTWGGLCIPLSVFSHGACLVLVEQFEPEGVLHLLERERITIWNAVDAMLQALLDCPDLNRCDRSRLRTGGLAMTGGGAEGLFEAAVERIGIRQAFQPYGMTEVNAMALYHDLDEPLEIRKLPGVRAATGLEARVVDPDSGEPRPVGQEGELHFRGPLVTGGYYNKPDETAEAFTPDGWFKTGDLAVRDEVGRLVFKGRLREALRISHFMVSPLEIEEFLMGHPRIHQAFVVGVPDPKLGEAPVAYIIPREGAPLTEEEIVAHCKGQIASFKIPRYIRFVPDVPRTPGPHGDKVQRPKLREQALRELGLEG